MTRMDSFLSDCQRGATHRSKRLNRKCLPRWCFILRRHCIKPAIASLRHFSKPKYISSPWNLSARLVFVVQKEVYLLTWSHYMVSWYAFHLDKSNAWWKADLCHSLLVPTMILGHFLGLKFRLCKDLSIFDIVQTNSVFIFIFKAPCQSSREQTWSFFSCIFSIFLMMILQQCPERVCIPECCLHGSRQDLSLFK